MSGTLSREALKRWELFGGTWRVLHASDSLVIVQLCACTGEPVECWESTLPEVVAHFRSRPDGAEA